jgi:hypothetical protein
MSMPTLVDSFNFMCKLGLFKEIQSQFIANQNSYQNRSLISNSQYMAFRLACENGHLKLAIWMHDKILSTNTERLRARSSCCWYALKNSIFNGHLNVAKWLSSHDEIGTFAGFMWDTIAASKFRLSLFNTACLNGHKDVAEWIAYTNNLIYAQCVTDTYFYIKTVYIEQTKQVIYVSVANKRLNQKYVSELKECCVCLDMVSNRITKCGHQYCSECVFNMAYNIQNRGTFSCPMCRSECSDSSCFIATDKCYSLT